MKVCPNLRCRSVHADEYNGQCPDCGAPLGGVAGSNQGELAFKFARQVRAGVEEAQQEKAMSRGSYDRVSVNDNLMEVARAGAYLLEKAAGRAQDWE